MISWLIEPSERNVSPIYLISTYIFVFCILGSRLTAQNKGGGIHAFFYFIGDLLFFETC
jgi:hypothetical protein